MVQLIVCSATTAGFCGEIIITVSFRVLLTVQSSLFSAVNKNNYFININFAYGTGTLLYTAQCFLYVCLYSPGVATGVGAKARRLLSAGPLLYQLRYSQEISVELEKRVVDVRVCVQCVCVCVCVCVSNCTTSAFCQPNMQYMYSPLQGRIKTKPGLMLQQWRRVD